MAYGKYQQKLDNLLIQRKDKILANAKKYDIKLPSMEKMRKTVGRNQDVSDGIIILRYINAQMHIFKRWL